jgi:hypothetical protein
MNFFAQILPHAFDGGILRVGFFGFGSTLIDAHTLPGKLALACKQQTEGLEVGCGKTKGFIKTKSLGWAEEWVGGV